DRALVVAALAPCRDHAGRWRLARDGDACVATLRIGVPTIELRAERAGVELRGSCRVTLSEDLIAAMRAPVRPARGTRIRVGAELFGPPGEWTGSPPVVDPLLADDTSSIGDRARRVYPYGATLPELGWVNPFDIDRSLGLDGWIHAALRKPSTAGPSCGTL